MRAYPNKIHVTQDQCEPSIQLCLLAPQGLPLECLLLQGVQGTKDTLSVVSQRLILVAKLPDIFGVIR